MLPPCSSLTRLIPCSLQGGIVAAGDLYVVNCFRFSRSDYDHESSRRIKTEFLLQMDGAKRRRVQVIGATNNPNELDEATRQR